MTLSTAQFNNLIRLAQAGDEDALGKLLEGHRGYLRLLAQRELGGRLQARLDGSDVVQQTFFSACRNFVEFDGTNAAQFAAWLHRIHERNISDAVRDHVHVAKRAVGRETKPETSSHSFDPPLRTTSPSQRAMQGEDIVRLSQVVEELPPDQHEAIRLRHLEGLSLEEIAEVLGRSRASVAGLLTRGMQKVRMTLAKIK